MAVPEDQCFCNTRCFKVLWMAKDITKEPRDNLLGTQALADYEAQEATTVKSRLHYDYLFSTQ